ncbi:MAG: DUF6544 family protein [Anaerolineales bacterium]|jgi:hypothetical protein
MHVRVDEKTRESVRQARQTSGEVITEADLVPLPEPVQRYLQFAQVIGKPRVRCVKVRQKGLMRTTPTQPWMPVEAVQFTTLAGPLTRTWYARIKMGPFALLKGYDCYDNGAGTMLIRLLSMFPVVNARGPEVDLSALIIFINDMVMWPTAFLSDYIHWEPVNAMAARARVNLFGKQFSAVCRFNETGELVDFITEERYRSLGKDFRQDRWSTPLRSYRETNGLRIPTEGEAIWHLPEGEFPYIQVSIGEVLYDTFDFA